MTDFLRLYCALCFGSVRIVIKMNSNSRGVFFELFRPRCLQGPQQILAPDGRALAGTGICCGPWKQRNQKRSKNTPQVLLVTVTTILINPIYDTQ
jgi:hypothetical protein